MKIIQKARIAGAVMLATAGVAVGTAQADSLLAPLVITNSNANIETYFTFRVRGSGVSDQFNVDGGLLNDTIHYHYIQKMTGLAGTPGADIGIKSTEELYTHRVDGGCKIQDNSGKVSSWDVVYQKASAPANIGLVAPGHASLVPPPVADASKPNGWNPVAGPFYGMMVIDDVSNLAPYVGTNGRRDNEGDFIGFAYVVDADTGFVFDYKLLNNSHSKRSGDFKAAYISKKSIDWMWLPTLNPAGAGALNERTAWYTAVTGEGMSGIAENAGGRWDESVTFTQNLREGSQDVKDLYAKNGLPGTGAYDNDEDVVSGPRDLKVTCLGMYSRLDFLTSLQIPATVSGGWKRAHIIANTEGEPGGVMAHGAITYRMDNLVGYAGLPATAGISVQVETSGHVSTGSFGQHPNRGY